MSAVKILIVAGGSGGHIFPAVATARALKSSAETEIKFVGSSKEIDKRIFEKEGFSYALLSANKFPAHLLSLRLVPFAFKFFLDIVKSYAIILKFKPNIVVGFGGYLSCPVILAASSMRIPTLVHEQNVAPGRANRLLFKFADRIAVSFDATLDACAGFKSKCMATGNPIRQEILKGDRSTGIRRFGLDEEKFTILVVGGSQGAHFLNRVFIEEFFGLDEASRRSFQVIHLTGIKDYEWAIKTYGELTGLESRVYSFIDRIEEAYSASDLIVTRAGASAIFESAYFAKPMILVPYPHARNHQKKNAAAFSEKGAAVMIEEKDLTPKLFRETIQRLYAGADERRRLSEAARRMSVPAAAANLAREILRLSEKERSRK